MDTLYTPYNSQASQVSYITSWWQDAQLAKELQEQENSQEHARLEQLQKDEEFARYLASQLEQDDSK